MSNTEMNSAIQNVENSFNRFKEVLPSHITDNMSKDDILNIFNQLLDTLLSFTNQLKEQNNYDETDNDTNNSSNSDDDDNDNDNDNTEPIVERQIHTYADILKSIQE